MYNKDNPFYSIVTEDNKSNNIYSDDICVVVLDIKPDNPGHILIISRGLYKDIESVSKKHIEHIFLISQKMVTVLKESLGATGVKIIQNNGESAGQQIYHFHIHLIPYYDTKIRHILLEKDIEYFIDKMRSCIS